MSFLYGLSIILMGLVTSYAMYHADEINDFLFGKIDKKRK